VKTEIRNGTACDSAVVTVLKAKRTKVWIGLREHRHPCRWQYFVYIYYKPVAELPKYAAEQSLRGQVVLTFPS
jgi:hypothetical protein